MTTNYQEFLRKKLQTVQISGFEVQETDINPMLFKFQNAGVRWALRLGKAAMFEECGLGKSFQQIEWARLVAKHTGGKVLILAPLAVTGQTVLEGAKLGVTVKYVREQVEVGEGDIFITNYDRLHLFDTTAFTGVVLDESSILKSFMGKTKRAILEAFKSTPYKLACTATPAPNDHLELGNHAAFLDVMESNEMISRWFINDAMEAGSYRLKGHAAHDFWRWLTSWAICLSKPGDLGAAYDMPSFDLPELNIHEHWLASNAATIARAQSEGMLMPDDSPSATSIHKVKRESLSDRVAEALKIMATIPADEPVIIWCDTDYEADALVKAFPEAVEVRGPTKDKEQKLIDYAANKFRVLITKPEIAGFGLNYQHCAYQIFVGVAYSFERTYQALRRSYRFGQPKPVNVYMIYAETEGNVMTILKEKQEKYRQMQNAMNNAMNEHGLFRDTKHAELQQVAQKVARGENWTMYLGDSCEVIKQLPDNSIDFGVSSPPFENLYIYSDAEADMGNSADSEEFFQHYTFLITEMLRTTRPGRLCAVHCKDLPTYMGRDGASGLRDFPGKIIQAFEAARFEHEKDLPEGEQTRWQYHSRVTIWKDPAIEMQRTKNHGLLHKNFANMSEACRQGMPDYVIVFRKWPLEGGVAVKQKRVLGDYIGTEPPNELAYKEQSHIETDPLSGAMNTVVTKAFDQRAYSIAVWQRYASPVWFDIDQTNVLNYQMAKGQWDDKHICPLQLDVIARCVDLWSNKGETVFSPFAGIGSEGYEAVRLGRKFIGIELKESYWRQAQKFLAEADAKVNLPTLFDLLPAEESAS